MKKILIIVLMTLLIFQVQSGQKDLIEREKNKLLALRELVLNNLRKAEGKKNVNIQFKVHILETDQGPLIKLIESTSFGKEHALKTESKGSYKLVKTNKEPEKQKSRTFYNDMKFLNP